MIIPLPWKDIFYVKQCKVQTRTFLKKHGVPITLKRENSSIILVDNDNAIEHFDANKPVVHVSFIEDCVERREILDLDENYLIRHDKNDDLAVVETNEQPLNIKITKSELKYLTEMVNSYEKRGIPNDSIAAYKEANEKRLNSFSANELRAVYLSVIANENVSSKKSDECADDAMVDQMLQKKANETLKSQIHKDYEDISEIIDVIDINDDDDAEDEDDEGSISDEIRNVVSDSVLRKRKLDSVDDVIRIRRRSDSGSSQRNKLEDVQLAKNGNQRSNSGSSQKKKSEDIQLQNGIQRSHSGSSQKEKSADVQTTPAIERDNSDSCEKSPSINGFEYLINQTKKPLPVIAFSLFVHNGNVQKAFKFLQSPDKKPDWTREQDLLLIHSHDHKELTELSKIKTQEEVIERIQFLYEMKLM